MKICFSIAFCLTRINNGWKSILVFFLNGEQGNDNEVGHSNYVDVSYLTRHKNILNIISIIIITKKKRKQRNMGT